MLSGNARKKWAVLSALGIIILFGALLRLHDLDRWSIGHVEINTPGIELPKDLANFHPRSTLAITIMDPIYTEPHPPGYYVLMFGWTKIFGAGIRALRMPSVLFGVASIFLIYILASLEGEKLTAVLAAGMLAFNGYHILWSQVAKMTTMGCFLGLLSTALLLWASRSGARQRLFQSLYLVTTLAGLATTVFFWPIFATHMLWILGKSLTRKGMTAGWLRLQILIFILGSPLWAMAAYQSRRPSYLEENFFLSLVKFFQFGFLLDPNLFNPDPWAGLPLTLTGMIPLVLLALLAVFLLVKGFKFSTGREREIAASVGPSPKIMAPAGVLMFLGILAFAQLSHDNDPSRTKLIVASGAIPLLLPMGDHLLRRYWSRLQSVWGSLSQGATRLTDLIVPLNSLTAVLAILPITMMAGVSLFIPILAPRTVFLLTPFLFILLSRGLVSLINQNKAWVLLVPLLAVVFSVSVIHYKNSFPGPTDYKGLAEKWTPQIKDSDVIFVEKHWVTTPIFYYLKADRYRVIARNYADEVRKFPDSRVWVLSFPGLPMNDGMKEALATYNPASTLSARRIKTELFVPQSSETLAALGGAQRSGGR